MQIRLTAPEKEAFAAAAQLSGMQLSVWVRDVLRRSSQQILLDNKHPVAFMSGS